jgi:acyl-CoA thioester hydrolase
MLRRVQFHETDAAGIVHFSWFFRYMEEAETALWRQAGLSVAPADEMGWPRVTASFEYHSPLRFEDEFEMALRIDMMTRRTIQYRCLITLGERKIATGVLKVVCVRKHEGKLEVMEIPPGIAARLGHEEP